VPRRIWSRTWTRKLIHPTTARHTCDTAFSRCCCAAATIDDRDELSSHVQLPVREAGNREDGGKSRTEGWRGRRQPEEKVVPWWSVSAPAPVCVVFLRAVGAAAVWGRESGEVGRQRGKAGAVADDDANVDLAVEEEGSGERSSCDRGMEEAWSGGDETDGDDLTHIDGQCRLAEGRTSGGSLPLTTLIGSIDCRETGLMAIGHTSMRGDTFYYIELTGLLYNAGIIPLIYL
jgi:hypothetical protein